MNRRDTLGLLGSSAIGAAALGTLTGSPDAAAATAAGNLTTLNPANADDLALIHRKLAWSMDETVGFWWLKGRRYAAFAPSYTPLWDMLIGTIFIAKDLGSDGFSLTTITTTFYSDINTGQLLENFHNPLTGKDLKVPYATPKASTEKYSTRGIPAERKLPGTTMSRYTEPGPAWIEGNDVWVRSDVAFRAAPDDPMKKTFVVEDLSTYFGSLKDVANPKLKAVPAGQVFTDVLNYPAWLEMGDRNGHFFSRCFGRKVFKQSEMPQDWQRLMAERYPAIAKDPQAALG